MNKVSRLFAITKNMGVKWIAFRAFYEFKRKTGILEHKFPPKEPNQDIFKDCFDLSSIKENTKQFVLDNCGKFSFNSCGINDIGKLLNELYTDNDAEKLIKIADCAIEGKLYSFSNRYLDYGFPINWHYNPINKCEAPKDKHWSRIGDLSKELGDIKYIWEASRFSQVYYFVRAYALTGDERFVKAFWDQLEAWIDKNPAELGVNWKCGQELSIRLAAWAFGLFAFLDSPYSTDYRIFKLLKSIYYQTEHIEKNFEFALKSVKNNHTISEAAGMFTTGILFPFFNSSDRWLKSGKRYLESEGLWQFYNDGTYIQHSVNYNRLTLQNYTWCIRLGQLNNVSFTNKLIDRLNKSVEFLYNLQDDQTGKLPNYGSNDGAIIHVLSMCDYTNFKPQLNAMYYVINNLRLYPKDLHDENLLWLCGKSALSSEYSCLQKSSSAYPEGGYYTIRNASNHGMLRCATYRHRPFHADMLHLDLWWDGINVFCDGGTYSYNCSPELEEYFTGTQSHNTLMIDNKSQMTKVSAFMWIDWTSSFLRNFSKTNNFKYFEGEHYGYLPLVHRRAVVGSEDYWIVIDDVIVKDNQRHSIVQSWLFGIDAVKRNGKNSFSACTGKSQLSLSIYGSCDDSSIEFIAGNDIPTMGWQALYYSEKSSAPQILYKTAMDKSQRIITILSRGVNIELDNSQKLIRITKANQIINQYALSDIGADTLIVSELPFNLEVN